MDERELQEIKTRAGEVKKLLGDGSYTHHLLGSDVPRLVAEIEQLMSDLTKAGVCPHGILYKEETCIDCFGDGTEQRQDCSECGLQTWHRGGKCLGHDASAPKPYELLNAEVQQLRSKLQTVQESCSARVAEAGERLTGIEAACAMMKESLEYVRGRIGSTYVGDSLIKIDKALSSSTDLSSPVNNKKAV